MSSRRWAVLAAASGVIVSLWAVPRRLCQSGAETLWRSEAETSEALSKNVDRHLAELGSGSFRTGSRRFDGEWRFGTALMASLGFGQVAREHPQLTRSSLERMDRALDAAMSERARAFDVEAWGEDPLTSLDSEHGHVAYLGYLNLALSVRRFVQPESRFAAVNDRLSKALERRLSAASAHVAQTYPGEIYPVDNSAAVASLALRARALGTEPPPVVAEFIHELSIRFVDPKTGLLHQSLTSERAPADAPRGSGTALAAYFLSFADEPASLALHRAVRRELAGDVLGFGVVHEYADGARFRSGDIDSGPLVFGLSISAMGFGMAGCRVHGDRASFIGLYRSFNLLGAPSTRGSELSFAAGGPLGNAIVFAMLTALPPDRWRRA